MTNFTTTSPTSFGAIPNGLTEVGGIVLDLVGLNGTRIISQVASSELFNGFFNSGTPAAFQGEPGTIGTQLGFTAATINALGGGLSEVAVRITLRDGDSASGEFDFNKNQLLLNGKEIGNFSTVETQVTSSDGLLSSETEFGFGNGTLNTGWFYSNDAGFLTDFFQTLVSGQVQFQLSDDDPYDNYFDFTGGVDGGQLPSAYGANAIMGTESDDTLHGTSGND